MADIKEDIEVLESKISMLKVAYEQYFMRIIKMEPLKLRGEIDKIIMFHSNKPINSSMLKFRFNSAVSKYNAYKQYWNRTVRAIDEGHFTKAAETGAFTGGLSNHANHDNHAAPPAGLQSNHVERASDAATNHGQAATPAANHAGHEAGPPVATQAPSDAGLAKVFQEYIETRKRQSESVDGLTYDAFARSVGISAQKVKETYKAENIDVKVVVKDGKTKVTIVPKK